MNEMFGLWSTSTNAAAGDLAFAVSGETPRDAIPIWQADLSLNPETAARTVEEVKLGLKRTEVALETAEPRIDALVQKQKTPISFSTTTVDEELARPEQELLGLLQEAQFGTQRISFSTEGDPSDRWEDTVTQFQNFTIQVQRTLTHFAWVETSIGGQLVARSSINWLGDLETQWQDQLNSSQMNLHRDTLQNALAGRILMLRTLVVIAASASKLSVLLSTPGGALLALPAAWKFINKIREELGRHQQIMEGNQNGK
jgi:hypothetical protein